MILTLPEVIPAAVLDSVVRALDQAEFVAGELTARGDAALAKNNLQLVPGSGLANTAASQVLRALSQCREFTVYARPRTILPPLFCRYEPGMSYGPHLDRPVMGRGKPVRTDLSITLFLSRPEGYEGGELVVWQDGHCRKIKGEAGSAVVYPSGCRHEVQEVTAGQRLVAVSWIESLVADARKRELLHDLSRARAELESGYRGATSSSETRVETPIDRLRRCEDALLRMWIQT